MGETRREHTSELESCSSASGDSNLRDPASGRMEHTDARTRGVWGCPACAILAYIG
jgi:hypothetical protein